MQDGGCQRGRAAVHHPIIRSSQSGLFTKEPCFAVCTSVRKGSWRLVLGDPSGQATGINMKT